MMSLYKRKKIQYLQKIERISLGIADRFSISSFDRDCAVPLSDHVRKWLLYGAFCCLSMFYLFRISSELSDFNKKNLNDAVKIRAMALQQKTAVARQDINTPLITKEDRKTDRYNHYIFKSSEQYQVDPYLIKAIIMTESSYNPKAVSYRGAKGLMQLMPATARELGVSDCFNPEDNIDGGVKYISILLDRFDGKIDLALAAYHAGSAKVRKYNGVPPFRTTRKYIKKVNRYYFIFKNEDTSIINRV